MKPMRFLTSIVRRAFVVLLLGAVSRGAAVAQQQSAEIQGTVYAKARTGKPRIRDARVQLMDPKGKLLLQSTRSNNAAWYELKGITVGGDYEVVACEDFLEFKPQGQSMHISPSGAIFDFTLEHKDPAHPLPLKFGNSQIVVYLKDIETGCEFGAFRSDQHGLVSIPNTVDEGALLSRNVLCVDDAEETDSTSPFESCVQKELPAGLSESEVRARFGKPERTDTKGDLRILVYREVRVTISRGKVSSAKVEIESPKCLVGHCPGK